MLIGRESRRRSRTTGTFNPLVRLLFCLTFLTSSWSMISQDLIANYRHLTTKNGINFRKVNTVCQDDSGLIWIGTDLGLQFYDGHDFFDYSYSGIGDKFRTVTSIAKSSNGDMYLSSSSIGVLKYNPKTSSFNTIGFDKVEPSPYIKKIVFSPTGALIAISKDRAYALEDEVFVEMEKFPINESYGLKNKIIQCEWVDEDVLDIMFDQYDVRYNTSSGTILNFKSRIYNKTETEALLQNTQYSDIIYDHVPIVQVPKGTIDLSKFTSKGPVFKGGGLNVKNSSVYEHVAVVDSIMILVELHSNSFLVYQNDKLELEIPFKGVGNLKINDFFIGQNEELFVATNNGIMILELKEALFKTIDQDFDSEGGFNSSIRKIAQTPDGYLVYTQGRILKLFGEDTILSTLNVGKPILDFYALDSTTYFALSATKSWIIEVEKDKLNIAKELDISGYVIQKIDSTFLIGGNGLVEYDLQTNRVLKHICSSTEQIMSICLGTDGHFFVGSQNGLIEYDDRFNIVKKLENQSRREFDQVNINDIHIDQEGLLWLATQGNGVVVLDQDFGIVKRINTLTGLPHEVVYSINFDGESYWFPTDYGLARYDQTRNDIINYYEEDGLSNNEFNRYSNLVTERGDIYLGTLNGIVQFVNKDVKLGKKSDLKLFISDASLSTSFDSESISLKYLVDQKQEIEIADSKEQLKFSFGITDFISPRDNQYEYRLSAQQKWVSQGNRNSIELLNLSSGRYDLEIVAKSRGGQVAMSVPIAIVSIPPVYKRWWFLLLSFAVIGLFFYMIYRWRLRQINHVQTVRESISRDLHDEVGSMLTEITILSDLTRKLDPREEQKEFLEKISSRGRDAISAMSDVIWTIDSRSSTLDDLITKMNQVMACLLSPAGILFEISKTNINLEKVLSINAKKNIYLVFKEAIHNVVKHNSTSVVQVNLAQIGTGLVLSIINERSNKPEKTWVLGGNGLGVHSMKERAKAIGGTLTVTMTDDLYTVNLNVPKL